MKHSLDAINRGDWQQTHKDLLVSVPHDQPIAILYATDRVLIKELQRIE